MSEIVHIPANDLQLVYPEIKALGWEGFQSRSGLSASLNRGLIIWKDFSPNPVREVANGKPVFSLRVMPWADDVSGNWSKQYNPHVNIYMKNLSIPSEKLKQQFFVRFCSTSP